MNNIIEKWSKTGLLEGIEDSLRKQFVAETLEKTANWLVIQANKEPIKINEDTTGIILPMMGRVSRETDHFFQVSNILDKFMETKGQFIQETIDLTGKDRNYEELICELYSVIVLNLIKDESDKN